MNKMALIVGSVTIVAVIAAVVYFIFGDYLTDFEDPDDFDGTTYAAPDN